VEGILVEGTQADRIAAVVGSQVAAVRTQADHIVVGRIVAELEDTVDTAEVVRILAADRPVAVQAVGKQPAAAVGTQLALAVGTRPVAEEAAGTPPAVEEAVDKQLPVAGLLVA